MKQCRDCLKSLFFFWNGCRLFCVLFVRRFNTFRALEAGKKNIQWEDCACFCVCVRVCVSERKKDNEDLYPWLCLHGNLPTLILLYKLIQKKKSKESQ